MKKRKQIRAKSCYNDAHNHGFKSNLDWWSIPLMSCEKMNKPKTKLKQQTDISIP